MEAQPIRIRLSPSLGSLADATSDEREEFVTRLESLVSDLHRDLGLPPPAPRIHMSGDAPESVGGLPPFELSVGDRRCRLPREVPRNATPTASSLAAQVSEALHAQRALLVPANLATELHMAWRTKSAALAAMGPVSFHALLRNLAHRGLCLDWARGLGDATAGASTEESFEFAVGEIDGGEIGLGLGSGFDPKTPSAGETDTLDKRYLMLQDGLFYELGLRVPRLGTRPDSALAPREFRVRINDVWLPPQVGLAPGKLLVDATPDRLKPLGIEGSPAANPANGNASSIVDATPQTLEGIRSSGLTSWGPNDHLILCLSALIRRHAGSLISRQTTEFELLQLQGESPQLVAATRRRYTATDLTRIFRHLLDEEVSIRNLRAILESLLAIQGSARDQSDRIVFIGEAGELCLVPGNGSDAALQTEDLAGRVRMSMHRQISHQHTRGRSTLPVLLVGAGDEQLIANSIAKPLEPADCERLLSSIHEERSRHGDVAILVGIAARAAMRRLLEIEFPRLPVLCYQELTPDMNIQPLARVSMSV